MTLKLRTILILSCMALVFAGASTLYAETYSISGEYWSSSTSTLNDSTNQNVPVPGSAVYSTQPDAVFTVTNSTSATSLINFNADYSQYYYVSGFLNDGFSGDGNTISWVSGASHASDYLDDTLYLFQGTTNLTDGSVYTFAHDDGFLLYLNGQLIVNDGGPSSPTDTTLCIGSATGCDYSSSNTGTQSFALYYAEVDGPGAVLYTDLPLTGPVPTVTPEPSSLMLLGSGLAAFAAALRRRLAR